MAILSKIRERSLFLIVVIALALFAFVIDPSTLMDFFNASKVNEVGQVNGEAITRQQFAEALDNYKAQTGGRVSEMQAAKSVWNNLLRQKVYESQLKEAGVTIGEEDIMNALYESPAVKQDQRFLTQGIFDKAKLKEHLATIKGENSEEWKAWQGYMVSLKENLQKTTYDNLVGAGLGATLQEGKTQYFEENTKISGDLVYLPYTTVADSLVTVTKSEVKSYVEAHPKEFEVEASRDIKYVKYDIIASPEDEADIKAEVAKLIEDEDLNGVVIKGLKNTTDYTIFFSENDSDTPLNETVQYKSGVPQVIAEDVFAGNLGDVFGPYKDENYFKISKITEVLQLPDSVKASHILIPFVGSSSATPEVTQTKEQAKVTADSIMTVVKRNKSKFADLAKEFSADKSNAEKGGDLDWFTYNRMVPSFRDFCFENKTGDIGVVESQFGYHVINIEGQKNFQNAVKLATFSRVIEASEATENIIYEEAETLAQALSTGDNFDTYIKENKLSSKPAVGLKALDENVPGIGNERQIVSWAFEKDLPVGSSKRFDVEGGYVVATLTGKTEKGLMPTDKAIAKVRPILVKEKKAALLDEKFSGSSLADIESSTGQKIKKVSGVSLQSPTISGVGFEPKVVGSMMNAKVNELYKSVAGDRGVYAFVVKQKDLPTELPNYDTYRKRIVNQRKGQTYRMYEAIKDASDVDDNLSSFYGVE